jgi:AcrR family transcriptional regulator
MLSEILSLLIESITTKSNANSERIKELFEAASAPDAIPDLGSAMEVIVASRRDEVISEVVQRDINGLMEDHGVGPSTDGADRQAVVGAISTVFGAALLNSAYNNDTITDIDPFPFLGSFMVSLQSSRKPSKPAGPVREVAPYAFPTTYDDVRDALISASEYVIARSGVHRATVSRIARRAGVSVGAIYGLYENKDSLVADCLEVLFPPQTAHDARSWAGVFTAPDQRAMVTQILTNYMSPSYVQWRRFRLEAFIAARHSDAVSEQIASYAAIARRTILQAAENAPTHADIRPDTGMSSRATVIGLSIFEIVDPTITSLDWRWVPVR